MIHQILYSLRIALETEAPELTKVQIQQDGVTPIGIEKPFGTVRYLFSEKNSEAAGRRYYSYVYRMQVGLYARDYAERLRIETQIDEILGQAEGIPLFDDSLLPTGDYILCDVGTFTPMTNDEISNKTNDHRGYYDVSVRVYRQSKGGFLFSQ
ncbi:hypothetical protein [Terribacillus saccharophilus]|uniref:Uncharacterized protein n=1 Tax=Terribacillus saccharophilus TaxID=361277 RepID=A0ABX4H0C1_9BACI|nr:hypothetical protein [Terribacillus saccharophilus]PAD35978.1 hypothetical protein CHH56_06005 [Terribacillus saccharophilus]PAD96972.1 hypothetical protein CHH50_06305 [Terribacillus saccharophilus]PAE00548.1 hypothetical protein CHH48_07210 [Terribacillus saccharophilus]